MNLGIHQEINSQKQQKDLEQFQTELHAYTKLLTAKHFSTSLCLSRQGEVKLDDWIWNNSSRLATEISELVEMYQR